MSTANVNYDVNLEPPYGCDCEEEIHDSEGEFEHVHCDLCDPDNDPRDFDEEVDFDAEG